jgi:Repeat of unknown function (DUF5648)
MTRGRLMAAAASVLAAAIGGLAFWPDAQADQKPAGTWAAEPSRAAAAGARAEDGAFEPAGEPGAKKTEPSAKAPAPNSGDSRRKTGGDATSTATDAAALPAPLPLLHLVNRAGVSLYTLSQSEAATAETRHQFKIQSKPVGYMRARNFPGSQPVYRLTKVGGGGWVLTPSSVERNRLVSSGKFKNEGVVGYAAARRAPGTVLLSRYRGPKDWRVVLAAPYGNPQAMLATGYKLDGPVGYVYPTASTG